jgi:ribose 5-phosphate isomerase B
VQKCKSAYGLCKGANVFQGVGAVLAWSVETAKLGRDHNNANVVGIGGRMHSIDECKAIIDAFIETPFSNDERHVRRINKIAKYENEGKL